MDPANNRTFIDSDGTFFDNEIYLNVIEKFFTEEMNLGGGDLMKVETSFSPYIHIPL